MRNFQLTITDSDGESHVYLFVAPTPWEPLLHVRKELRGSDFYGHEYKDTMNLHVEELVAQADMTGAIYLPNHA